MNFDVRRGQIYLADLNSVKGSEQGGIRPVVVVQNDVGNKYSTTIIVAPITGQKKVDLPNSHKVVLNRAYKGIYCAYGADTHDRQVSDHQIRRRDLRRRNERDNRSFKGEH